MRNNNQNNRRFVTMHGLESIDTQVGFESRDAKSRQWGKRVEILACKQYLIAQERNISVI